MFIAHIVCSFIAQKINGVLCLLLVGWLTSFEIIFFGHFMWAKNDVFNCQFLYYKCGGRIKKF